MNKIIFHSLTFLLFFALFYFESLELGGIKIAIIWKILLIGLILIYISLSKSTKISKFIFWGYVYSIKNLFTISLFQHYASTITESIKSIIIPLFAQYFGILIKHKNLYKKIVKINTTISIYILLSTLPFLFGLINPLTTGYNLSIFGLEAFGFVGIFQRPASASFTIAFAIIVLSGNYKYTKTNNQKILYLILIVIGLYAELLTFTRSGYGMLLFSLFYIFMKDKRVYHYLKMLPIILIVLVGVVLFYQHSEAFQMRIIGKNLLQEQDNFNINILMSGRLGFARSALYNWSQSGIGEIIFGLGKENSMLLMEESVGLKIYAHNGFIDVLQFNGIVGALIYVLFYSYLFLCIRKGKKKNTYVSTVALFIAYTIGMLVQGEHIFITDVILSISIVSHIGNKRNHKQIKLKTLDKEKDPHCDRNNG